MNQYVTGAIIKELREKNQLTQLQLAEKLGVSDKTISKWETSKGLPDITLLMPLAQALKVSLIELVCGYEINNNNISANFNKGAWYVCPICGNVIHAMGEAVVSCCGVTLPIIENEEASEDHKLIVTRDVNEYVVSIDHPMTKEHYICFLAYTTDNGIEVAKLYPESEAIARFTIKGHGLIHAYCNHHGKFVVEV